MGLQRSKKESLPKRTVLRSAGLPRFFSKQLLVFLLLAFSVVVIDLFIYTFIALNESNTNFHSGTPTTTMRVLDSNLTSKDGSYSLLEQGVEALAAQDAWAMLIDDTGTVIWSQNLPDKVPLSYSLNDIAMAVHYANIVDFPVFFWDRNDGLLILGFPQGTYWHVALSLPESTVRSIPLYVLLILGIDLALFFVAYLISRRRTQSGILPIVGALDSLSQGRPSTLNLKGDLREIGEKITEASAVLERKDTARANWIRGVSHDIRTPLSMMLGYADGIAEDQRVPENTRIQAAVIRTQGFKIKDLVTDLNTASQLDYDMQPLNLERIHLARLLRSIAATYMNEGLAKHHPLEIHVDSAAEDALILGDERLLTRALENALTNARLHNEQGCAISITLQLCLEPQGNVKEIPRAVVCVADDGQGASAATMSALETRLARSRTITTAAGCAMAADESSTGTEHGLGLVLVDRITRAHGGFLMVDGTPGGGFSVKLTLPLA